MKLLFYFVLFSFGSLVAQEKQFVVLNKITNQPIENVLIYEDNLLVTSTNEKGEFTLDLNKLPGNFQLKIFGYKLESLSLTASNDLQILYLSSSVESLSEVIIRSTIIPKSLQKSPSSISLVTASDFKRTDATALLESFNNVAGIYVNQGALNTNKINIRGIGSRAQFSTNRIQAYFDGIPLSTAEGELTLDDFDQEGLDRIEVIKGPTSSMYGSGLGGSINLFSKNDGKIESTAKISSQFGSFNTQKQVLQASNVTAKSSFYATIANLTSDGYRENGNYDRKSALINGSINTGKEGKISFLANLTRLKAFIPSSINEETFLNNPERADINWKNAQGFESYDRGLFGVSYSNSIFKNFTNITSAFLSFRDGYEPRPFDILDENTTAAGIRTKFNLSGMVFKLPAEVSFGGEYYNEWYKTQTFDNLYEEFPNQGSVQGNRLSENDQDRNYANFFAQVNLDLSEKWNIEGGFSVNSTRYKLTDLFEEDEVNQTGNYRFETIFSPRLATSYEFLQGKNIYASMSQGFSTPTVAETLNLEGQINTDLRPEIGTNYEIGFKGNWFQNNLYTEISFYSIQVDNLLVAERVAEDQFVGLNAGKTDHNGIEFLTKYNLLLTKNITLKPYFNAVVNFFKFDEFLNEGIDFSGNLLPGTPKYTANFGIDFLTQKGLDFFVNWRSVGQIPLDDENSDFTDQYNLINLKAGYDLKVFNLFDLNIYAGVNNLFDERYASSILTNAVGFGGRAPRYFYPGNSRNIYGGVQLNYAF